MIETVTGALFVFLGVVLLWRFRRGISLVLLPPLIGLAVYWIGH